jgi:hypothetical protein
MKILKIQKLFDRNMDALIEVRATGTSMLMVTINDKRPVHKEPILQTARQFTE